MPAPISAAFQTADAEGRQRRELRERHARHAGRHATTIERSPGAQRPNSTSQHAVAAEARLRAVEIFEVHAADAARGEDGRARPPRRATK